MGLEYKIICNQDSDVLDQEIRSMHGFSEYDQEHKLYYFRSLENQDAVRMPDATVAIEADGIYFVDNGGNTELVSIVFRRLIEVAFMGANEITIREL